jgi:hypothetical protein
MSVLKSPFFTASGTTENQNLVTQNVDGIEYVVGVELKGIPLDPTNSLWNTIVRANEAVAPFNIITGQSGKNPIDYIAPVELQFKYFDEQTKKGNNGSKDPRSLSSSNSGFYGSGIVGGPKQFQQPGTSGAYGAKNRRNYQTDPRAMAYPIDISTDQDHLMIKKYKYSRGEGLNRVNRSGPGEYVRASAEEAGKEYDGFVLLPMPKVSDSNGAEWGESDLNVFGVTAAGALAAPLSAVDAAGDFQKFGDAFGGGFNINDIPTKIQEAFGQTQDAIGRIVPDLAGSAAVGGALGGSKLLQTIGVTVEPDTLLARATGQIANPNAELLFQGPVLRDFGFQFLMIARSAEEGKMIRQIIRWFKQGAAPKYNNTALLKTPDIFALEYQTPGQVNGRKILTKFHDMALRTITVDYAPDGFWSAYDDSHPVACRMSLQFTELKPVYEDDYDGLDDDQVGY